MGAIGSVCCDDDSKGKKQRQTPAPNSKPLKKNTSPVKALKIEFFPQIQSSSTTQNKKKHNIQEKSTLIPKKQEDISEVIQRMYPAPKTVKWESFQIIGKIGSGGFGDVFLAELKENKAKGIVQKYAIKRVVKAEIYRKKLTPNLQLQKRILQQSKNNFITTLHYAFRDQIYLYFVMQWAQGGDTYTLINQTSTRLNDFKKAGEQAVRFILACLITGMQYLHKHNIMYRDLKPQNILIFQNGYAKLTDFGLAKEIRENQLSRTQAGTTIYYAPEMVLKQGYGRQIDIWAIGVYAYEMSNYYPPFATNDIKDKLKVKRIVKQAENNRTWKNPGISQQLKDFISSILKFQPKQRLGYKSYDQMRNHKFFTCANFDWKALQEMRIKSPLKGIIQARPIKYKSYNSNQVNKKANHPVNFKSQQPEGWTYVKQKQ